MFEKQKQQKRLLIGNKGVLGAKLHYKSSLGRVALHDILLLCNFICR